MTPDQIAAAAEALFQAERTGRQIGLLSRAHPEAGLDDAYAIQSALVARKLAAGARRIGRRGGGVMLAAPRATRLARQDQLDRAPLRDTSHATGPRRHTRTPGLAAICR